MSPLRLQAFFALTLLSVLLPTAPVAGQVVTVLHNFAGGANDGKNPSGSLTLSGTTLFGMTSSGGAVGPGTIFQLGTNGAGFGVIHSFAGGLNEGSNPTGSLTLSGSDLFGLTQGGGSAISDGTVFKIGVDASGFGLVSAFGGSPTDGSTPLGSLVQSGSTLYGMTSQGGTANSGTVFKTNIDGTGRTVLHSFTGGSSDGQTPSFSSLVLSGSTLYGMTAGGGTAGLGVVFKMGVDGSGFTLLHSFVAVSGDGWQPFGSLTLVGDTLYGMTRQGGGGAGTVFKINIDGTGYGIMHTFAGQPTGDGANPVGDLLLVGSTLYGTTPNGGTNGLGSLFNINTDASAYGGLYSFAGGPNDGANPGSGLINSGSSFYGVTGAGGSNDLGTIFSLTVVPEPSSLLLVALGSIATLLGRRRCLSRCMS
jgi:uncharacterized repeat protein (TIGR03803 family)